MNLTGIITEYNPFHQGHLHHLESAKKDTNCDGVICIMSGNFMQRGTPALLDKWSRAEIAVKNGVDLVIELPLIYSISSAEGFAHGACKILDQTSVIKNLYFGSEAGEITKLHKIAETLIHEPDRFKISIKNHLDKGLPFHTARSLALEDCLQDLDIKNIISNSNNILGIEYIKSLIKLNSDISSKTLKRIGSNYNDEKTSTSFSSATSIRKLLKENGDLDCLKNFLPNETYNYLCELKNNHYKFTFEDSIFNFLRYKLLTEGEKINNILDVSEGIENKILKEIINSNNINELILNVKSKRYTYSRISRILLSFFIGLENYDLEDISNNYNDYIRPLAFNDTGRKIIKEIKKKGTIEIITKLPQKITNKKLELDILGTKAYSILNQSISPIEDYLRSPSYLK
mgnify:CR=1 FL=1